MLFHWWAELVPGFQTQGTTRVGVTLLPSVVSSWHHLAVMSMMFQSLCWPIVGRAMVHLVPGQVLACSWVAWVWICTLQGCSWPVANVYPLVGSLSLRLDQAHWAAGAEPDLSQGRCWPAHGWTRSTACRTVVLQKIFSACWWVK